MLVVDDDFTSVRPDQTNQMFQQDAFSAAAPADNHHGVSGLDSKGHAAEHLLRTKLLLQVSNFNHGANSRPTSKVRKKLLIKIVIDAATTASVVARPTPSAPSPQCNPL